MAQQSILAACAERGIEMLARLDPSLYALLEQEYRRQASSLIMVASSSIADLSVLACAGTATINVTTEGYPGARFHAGCEVVDEIERLAIERAKAIFGAQYANVQPHSGSTANQIVLCTLLRPGDTMLGMRLDTGGHLTHGAKASISGRFFNSIGYGLTEDGYLDYDQVRYLAQSYRPKLIICGASSYPRMIDFKAFREIANEVGAYLLADISHVAGLVAAGVYPSPIDHAHITTTSTYKQLCGPRGGLILMGRDYMMPVLNGKKTLSAAVQKGVFPFFQSTPDLSAITAKAHAFARIASPEFTSLTERIVRDAQSLAANLIAYGYNIITRGTDTHIVLLDLLSTGLTGAVAERALEECGIIVNKNCIPGDRQAAWITSGLRIGTNSVACRKMEIREMAAVSKLIHQILSAVEPLGKREYALDQATKQASRAAVESLCTAFPIPHYSINDF